VEGEVSLEQSAEIEVVEDGGDDASEVRVREPTVECHWWL
jgi:hypothetical protein